MLSPLEYLKVINRRAKLEKAIALQRSAIVRSSIRLEAELNWARHVLATHYAAKGIYRHA